MRTVAKIDLKTKVGTFFPKGTEFDVRMVPGTYQFAFASPVGGGKPIRIVTRLLSKYFKGFVSAKISEEVAEEYMERGLVSSVAGKDVEVDGVDENGFPSILLVAGYV